MKNQFNCIGIAVLLHSIGVIIGRVHFWLVHLSFACDTWFVIIDSFTAFVLGVIHDFAVDTKFTISGSVGLGLVGRIVALIVLLVAVVVVGPLVLAPRVIVASVGIRLEASILWPLLRPESRDVLLVGFSVDGLLVDGVNGGGLLVHLHSVIDEKNFVCIFHSQPGLILVR
jgi:hypothetical protein